MTRELLDDPIAGSAAPNGRALAPRATHTSGAVRRAQRVHAAAVVLLPLLGSCYAAALVSRGGVRLHDLLLLVSMYVITIAGISVGFHRQLTHLAFQTGPRTRALLAIAGSMAAQGPVIYWVSNHRRHHQRSDKPGDPHSPHLEGDRPLGAWRGLWHAHIGWTFEHPITNSAYYCKDLLRDPVIVWVNRHYFKWIALGLALPALAGVLLAGGWPGAWSGLLWGGLVRLCLTYHATSGINSLTHRFGSRAFETRDHSRNNLLLVLPTLGEGWHNNHHAFPSSAFFGLTRWQLDLGGWIVRLLAQLKLAWNVRRPTPEQINDRHGAGRGDFRPELTLDSVEAE